MLFRSKVKEPQKIELAMLRSGQLLFTYLHLAADAEQTAQLVACGATAVAYETVGNDHLIWPHRARLIWPHLGRLLWGPRWLSWWRLGWVDGKEVEGEVVRADPTRA